MDKKETIIDEINKILYENSTDDSECMRIKFGTVPKIVKQIASLLQPDDVVKDELPDIYSGDLNVKRISKYRKLARGYNLTEATVRDIFCSGADWYKQISSHPSVSEGEKSDKI